VIERLSDQGDAGGQLQGLQIERHAERHDRDHREGDGKGMAEGDRDE
jgi:hypothetical protein